LPWNRLFTLLYQVVLIDTKLLGMRNNVAHGTYLMIDREEYLELHREIIGMLDLFSNQIQNAAVSKSFMRMILH
jgi:MAE_28990/MAE_18760-like HEPN